MTRVRWRLTLLAIAATLFALYPITTLFTSDAWFGQAALVVALVSVIGLVLRALTRAKAVIVLTQLLVTAWAVLLRFGEGTFAYLMPTTETFELANSYGLEALATIQKHSAPAPLNTGVTFCLVAAAALVAIAVDAAAATWQSPAAAGLPLLTAYLITAANGTEALRPLYFVVPVLLWLTMLHVSARSRLGRWGTTTASDGERDDGGQDRRALWALSSGATRFGMLAVLLAIMVPALVPHLEPRYLTDGLGRSGAAGGTGSVGFNDTLDLSASLRSTDDTPVLRYSTTGSGREPLRVLATSQFSRGQWLPGRQGGGGTELAPLPNSSNRTDYIMTVTYNLLKAPRLAAPYPVVAASIDGIGWTVDPVTRDVRVGERPDDYQITYTDLAPTAAELREAGAPSGSGVLDEDLTLPDSSRSLVTAWANEVTAGATNDLDRAIAIQDHLRDPTLYTYNLDLGPERRDDSGRVVEPVRNFYETRRGYCVQFATAMILMARAEGIPARMAIGFLPGTKTGAEYVVRAADAHAWPELYFEGYGWLRFEPTPATRSRGAPAYTVTGQGNTTGGGQAADDELPTSTATTPVRRQDLEGANSPTATGSDSWFGALSTRDVITLSAVLVGLLATLLMPLTAWLVRLRRRRAVANRQELVEVEWQELTTTLRDLGLDPPRGGTLRQWRQHFVTTGHLDADNTRALGRVTATLERARYDRPERTSPEQAAELHRDLKTIRRNVSRTRAWKTRLRSVLWPSTGVEAWRRLPRLLARRNPRGREEGD